MLRKGWDLPAFFLVSLSVAAQQPAPPKEPPPPRKDEAQKLEKIEVKGDELAERRESTAAKIIVNSDEITRYGDSNLLEVLKRLPGITVDMGPGGRGGIVRMRGLGAGYTQILVNGERMPPGFTLDSIAPDTIERIEIIRGATAEFSTAQAMAGTINVVLKRAVSNRKREMKFGASTEHGTWNENAFGQWADKSGALSWTIPVNVNRFAFRGSGTTDQSTFDPVFDLVQQFTGRRRYEGWGWSGNVAPRVSWELAKSNTVNVDGFVFHNEYRSHYVEQDEGVFGPPPPYLSGDQRTLARNRSYRVNAQWVRRFADGSRIDAKAGFGGFHYLADSDYVAGDPTGRTALERTVDTTFDDRSGTTIGKYTFPVTKGHAVSSGWDGAWIERQDTRLQQDDFPLARNLVRMDESFDTSVRRLALYVQDEWDVTERFAAYGGVRWEGIETRAGGSTFDTIRNRSSVTSPIVNLLWKLPGTQKDQVRVGLSRTYKPPQVSELVPRRFFSLNNTPVTPDYIGNPRLKPELAWGLDTGYEHYPTAGGNIGVSLYHRRVRDIVQREVTLEDGLYVSRPANIGNGTVTGLELDAKGKLSQLWEGAPGIDLRGNFAVNRSKVSYLPGPYNRLDQQVPWNGTVGVDYRFSAVPISAGSSFTARAGGTVRVSQNQVLYTSVTRQLEAYLLWRFSPAVQLRFSAQNLLAQDGFSANRYTDANGLIERSGYEHRFRRIGFLWELKL